MRACVLSGARLNRVLAERLLRRLVVLEVILLRNTTTTSLLRRLVVLEVILEKCI